MNKPFVGMPIHYRHFYLEPQITKHGGTREQPLFGFVTYVCDDDGRRVNLTVFDHAGLPWSRHNIVLMREGEDVRDLAREAGMSDVISQYCEPADPQKGERGATSKRAEPVNVSDSAQRASDSGLKPDSQLNPFDVAAHQPSGV